MTRNAGPDAPVAGPRGADVCLVLQLPDVLLQAILLRLSPKDRSACAPTCRRLRDLLAQPEMWPYLRLVGCSGRLEALVAFSSQARWRGLRALEAAFADAEAAGHAGRAFPSLRHARLTFTDDSGSALAAFAAAGGARGLTSLCLRARFPSGAFAAALDGVLEEAAGVRRACLTSAVTDRGLASLAAHGNLEALSLLFCLHVSAAAVAAAVDACSRALRCLALFPSPGRSPGSVLEALRRPAPSLRAVFLECLADEEVECLVSAAPNLAVVYISPHQRIGMRVLDHHVLHTTRIPSLSARGIAALCKLGKGLRGLGCRADVQRVTARDWAALWAACPSLELLCLDLANPYPPRECPLRALRDSLPPGAAPALRHLAISSEGGGPVSWAGSVVPLARCCPALRSLSLFGAPLAPGAGIESPRPPLCWTPAGPSRSLEVFFVGRRASGSPLAFAARLLLPPGGGHRSLQRVRLPSRLRRADSCIERPPAAIEGSDEEEEEEEDEIGGSLEQDDIESSSSSSGEEEARAGQEEKGAADLRRACPACRRLHVLAGLGPCCEGYCCGREVCLFASPWARRCTSEP